jgi:hypothetical protein
MKPASPWFLLILTVVGLAGAWPQAVAFTHFGETSWGCSYDSNNGVTASLTATGAVIFSVNGHCQNGPNPSGVVNGKLSYDPVTNRFSERLVFVDGEFANEIDTTGFCAANPWTNPASLACSNQAVNIKGDFGPADAAISSGAALAPFSLVAIPESYPSITLTGVQELFVNALAHASRPNPPASPVQVQAQSFLQQPLVSVHWLAPDESGDRPFTHFVVQARASAVPGSPWIVLGDTARNTSGSYSVTYRLPEQAGSPPGWFITACSATTLAMTCSGPITPAPARAEYIAGGVFSPGKFAPATPVAPKFQDIERHTLPPGTFIPPPVPLDVRFAAWATRVTAAWRLSGTNPNVIDDYSVEEKADNAAENWRQLGSVPRGSSRDYSTHVVRAASYSSWLRVCAESKTMRSCSQPVRVTSTPPQQSLQNDRTNVFRMLIPAQPGAGH